MTSGTAADLPHHGSEIAGSRPAPMIEIRVGDCRQILPELEAGSVHCCMTSPPYFGLRDYGTAVWEGGDLACDHGVRQWRGAKQTPASQSGHAARRDQLSRQECQCGARRIDKQIGLEATPEAFIANLVAVFREVRRVLRDDGTLWIVIGDSYAGSWGNQGRKRDRGTQRPVNGPMLQAVHDGRYPATGSKTGSLEKTPGLKNKDLIGIPWRLAFALQADGWYLRQDIIWHKPNPMPESVRDRCTKAHEYVFLLSKSQRYYFDSEAIKEPVKSRAPSGKPWLKDTEGVVLGRKTAPNCGLSNRVPQEARNRRSVWSIATQPYPGAHFAVFPPKLIEPCILAGCPEGGVVLDPFLGAGTTGLVAARLGRRCIGIDLSSEYVEMARARIAAAVFKPTPEKF